MTRFLLYNVNGKGPKIINLILNWQYKQTLHRMGLIGDWIPIVNRLALLTMQCQLSNVQITVSGFMGHNIFLEAQCLMLFSVFWEGANRWVNVKVKAKCQCTKETIDFRLQYKRCGAQSRKVLVYQLASSQKSGNTPIKSLTTSHIAVGIIDGLMVTPETYKHRSLVRPSRCRFKQLLWA